LRDYRKKANIPGFRPGMVPVGLVKKMYGKAVLAEEINKFVSENLYSYIRENNVNMLGEPLPNETEQKPIDFDTQEDFEFVFDLGIAPEFEVELSKKDKVKILQHCRKR
jgi:trigger factor